MDPRAQLSRKIEQESNQSLTAGAMFGAVMAFVLSLFLVLSDYFGLTANLEAPILWGFFCSLLCLFIFENSRRGVIRGKVGVYLVNGATVSLPSYLFLFAEFTLPSGAATYLNGAPPFLYVFVVIFSGMYFDRRLSIGMGLFAALQFLGFCLYNQEVLATITSPDPLLSQDVNSLSIYGVKAAMIAGSGWIVGFLSGRNLELMEKMIAEETEKNQIDRLFGQFVSAEVKNKIIKEKAGLVGESKEVALLFCDICSFTAFCEGKHPEEVVRRLNQYFDAMVQAISESGGVVDKFIGDAVMATFGGLLPLDNPSQSALNASRAMRTALAKLNERWAEEGLTPIENGIGIHFGQVLQGPLGSQDRREYTSIGDAVNTASRLESLTRSLNTSIVVSQAIYDLAEPDQQRHMVSLGAQSVKGRVAPVEVYSVPN